MRFAIAHENNFKNRPKSVFKYLNNAEMKKGTQKKNTRTHYIVQNRQKKQHTSSATEQKIQLVQMSVHLHFSIQVQFVISLDNKKNTKGAVPIISCEFKMYSTIVVDLNHLVSSLVFFFSFIVCLWCSFVWAFFSVFCLLVWQFIFIQSSLLMIILLRLFLLCALVFVVLV